MRGQLAIDVLPCRQLVIGIGGELRAALRGLGDGRRRRLRNIRRRSHRPQVLIEGSAQVSVDVGVGDVLSEALARRTILDLDGATKLLRWKACLSSVQAEPAMRSGINGFRIAAGCLAGCPQCWFGRRRTASAGTAASPSAATTTSTTSTTGVRVDGGRSGRMRIHGSGSGCGGGIGVHVRVGCRGGGR
jgi:hypothetical protein